MLTWVNFVDVIYGWPLLIMLEPQLTYPLGHMYRVHAVGVGRHMELNMLLLDPANKQKKPRLESMSTNPKSDGPDSKPRVMYLL